MTTDPTPSPDPVVATPPAEDPYLWLEEVTSERSLAWARDRNAQSQGELEAQPGFATTRDRILAILDSKAKLPYVTKRGKRYWNFWRDEANPRGVLRTTTLAEYRKAKPAWKTLFDLDALAAKEKENWVFAGNSCLYPTYDRCLMSLSRGGGDAKVTREFDPVTGTFVAGGFELPEAKSRVGWIDKDTVYVGTDFGPGSMTSAGYPRIVKEWKRGTPLAEAKVVFEGQLSDVATGASRMWDHGTAYDFVYRSISAWQTELYLRDASGELVRLDIPLDADVGPWNGQAIVSLRSDWTIAGKTWPRGALVATPWPDFLAGKRAFTLLFEPTPNKSLAGSTELKSAIVVNEMEDIRNKLYVWKVSKAGTWTKTPFAGARTGMGETSISAIEGGNDSDDYWVTHTDYTTPTTLSIGKLGSPTTALKQSPAFFDAKGLVVEQHFAASKDGTRVPYFQISRKSLELDGSNPTVLYGYGGFEVSLTPGYNPLSGVAWLERGGVYVVANIRGGGEYGPAWHQAAKGPNRQRAYEDFIAIAEDLATRKVTSAPKLGIAGGSNGGLLMGVMLTQRPDLFGAIVCSVPLLDMKRYHKLLAGASWMEEYGDPDQPDEWAYLSRYSPYQNVKAGVKYPRTLFTSSTRDDRVHPGHARKMVARMLEQGHDILYYENIEGGHGGAANNEQSARLQALEYTFLAKQLGLPAE